MIKDKVEVLEAQVQELQVVFLAILRNQLMMFLNIQFGDLMITK